MPEIPYVTDPTAALAAVNAATTIFGVRDAWNAHMAVPYGVAMALQTQSATIGYTFVGISAADFQNLRSYVFGMVKGLCRYPTALWQGSDLVSFHMVSDAGPVANGWAYPDKVFFAVSPLASEGFGAPGTEEHGEELLHHEGGHVLVYGYPATWLPGAAQVRPDWLAQNPRGFAYGQPTPYPLDGDEPLAFRSDYGRTNYFEDTAEVITGLFDRDGFMLSRLRRDVRLRKKARIWALFLNGHGLSHFLTPTADPALPPKPPPPADITVPPSGPLGLAPLTCSGLGQVTDYTVVITGPCGTSTVAILDGLSDLSWSRALDDVSTASAVVALDGGSRTALSTVRVWCHELHVYRAGDEVWSGPLVRVAFTADTVTFDARDNGVWLDRLAVEAKLAFKDTDLALIGEALVRQAGDLGKVAGCLLVESTMTGAREDRVIEKHSGYIGDALRELARSGLSFTLLGRRLLLFGAQPLSLLGPLSDDHFVGALEVVEDGLSGCTRAVVVGQGVTGVYSVPGACGTVTKLVRDSTITVQRDADTAALRLVQGGYPWPVRVVTPGTGTQLSADAPVCIDQLVPGVAIRTFSFGTPRQFGTDLQLTNLLVQAGRDRESVQVTLAPPAPSGDFPVPA